MTSRPQVIDLVLQNRLSELVSLTLSTASLSGGKCTLKDADLFFSNIPGDEDRALALCSGCPIQKQCLEIALQNNEEGIWGGTTHAERLLLVPSPLSQKLPNLDEAKAELKKIMESNASDLAHDYQVEKRTVHRWRSAIRENPMASELAEVQ